jgi:hypothetical protein
LKGWTGLLQIYQQATGQEMPPQIQQGLSKTLTTSNTQNQLKKERPDKSQASVHLYNLALSNGIRLFQDQHGIGYAQVPLTTKPIKQDIHKKEEEAVEVQGMKIFGYLMANLRII